MLIIVARVPPAFIGFIPAIFKIFEIASLLLREMAVTSSASFFPFSSDFTTNKKLSHLAAYQLRHSPFLSFRVDDVVGAMLSTTGISISADLTVDDILGTSLRARSASS